MKATFILSVYQSNKIYYKGEKIAKQNLSPKFRIHTYNFM